MQKCMLYFSGKIELLSFKKCGNAGHVLVRKCGNASNTSVRKYGNVFHILVGKYGNPINTSAWK